MSCLDFTQWGKCYKQFLLGAGREKLFISFISRATQQQVHLIIDNYSESSYQ